MFDIVKMAEVIGGEEIDVILDEDFPFPDYEIEIIWEEWQWNGARTKRLDETYVEGISINPIDFVDEGGHLDKLGLCKRVTDVLIDAYLSENRSSKIKVLS